MAKLEAELKQTRPFVSREEELYLSIQRTAEVLWTGVSDTLKQADLTPTQYNVLRILRGAGARGAACGEIGERMVTKDSDITRLLGRLDARGLITRRRETSDRRVVISHITQKGLDLIAGLDGVIAENHRRQLGHLGPERVDALIEMLEAVRDRPD